MIAPIGGDSLDVGLLEEQRENRMPFTLSSREEGNIQIRDFEDYRVFVLLTNEVIAYQCGFCDETFLGHPDVRMYHEVGAEGKKLEIRCGGCGSLLGDGELKSQLLENFLSVEDL